MPVISWEMKIAAATKAKSSNKTSSKTEVDLQIPMDEESAYRNNEGFLLVHTPVEMKEAMQNLKAKEALEKELRQVVRKSAQDEIGKKPEVTVVISRLSA